MERKIGEVFECNGKKYVVKETMGGCKECAFNNSCSKVRSILGNCVSQLRSDRKSIVFVEYKQEKIMENLLNCKGKKFRCKICGTFVEGRI